MAKNLLEIAFDKFASNSGTYIILPISVISVVYISFFATNNTPTQNFTHEIIPGFEAVTLYVVWILLQFNLALFCPGRKIESKTESETNESIKRSKNQLKETKSGFSYLLNGYNSMRFTFSLVILSHFSYMYDFGRLVILRGQLISVAILFSLLMSVLLFLGAGSKGQDFKQSESSNLKLFWFGRCLNPRINGFDLKFFLEGRTGLLLWIVVDFSFLINIKQITKNSTEILSAILSALLHFVYVFDYFFNEDAILTTMDITTERLGFMLCFGNIVWVPFIYSLPLAAIYQKNMQNLQIVEQNYKIFHKFQIFCGLILFFIGFYIFRKTNSEKNKFRKNPNSEEFKGKFIETKRGKRLLIKGMWGICRHFNYTGDVLAAWGMSVASCAINPFAYLYPIFLTGLIIHREIRDDAACRVKYGDDWEKYCKIVPYRLIPGVY